MTVSLYPVHEFKRNRHKRSLSEGFQTNVDPETGLAQKTIDQILAEGKNFRYIDNLNVLYSSVLAPESQSLHNSPFSKSAGKIAWTRPPKVAVVGGGLSGLMSAYQLGKVGMQVDVFEAGLAPITPTIINTTIHPGNTTPNNNTSSNQSGGGLFPGSAGGIFPGSGSGLNPQPGGSLLPVPGSGGGINPGPGNAIKSKNGAGRIRPVRVIPTDPRNIVELGAMRFPSNSFLFWHYISVLKVSRVDTYTDFPNVGKIPSLFTNQEYVNAFWPNNGNLSFSGKYADLNSKHINAFIQYSPPGGPAGLTIATVGQIVKKPNPSLSELKKVERFWTATIAALYRVTYKGFLKSNGFTDDEITKIGYMGVGTGGFAPLFDISVLDIVRLFVWDYAAELAVPDLWNLPERIRSAGALHGVKFHYSTPIQSVAYSRTNKNYAVAYGGTSTHYSSGYDFLIIATSHVAAQRLLSKSQAHAGSGITRYAPDPVYAYYDTRYKSLTSQIKSDLENQGYMPAVKIFHSIYGPTSVERKYANPWTTVKPKQAVTYDKSVRAMFGTFAYTKYTVDLGVTYVLPYPGKPLASSTVLTGLHYSWGADAHDVRMKLFNISPRVKASLEKSGVYKGRYPAPSTFGLNLQLAVMDRFRNIPSGPNVDGDAFTGTAQYFGDANTDPGQPYANYAIVDWEQVPYVWLGFKLDSPGRGAHLIYSYKTITEATVNNNTWDTQTATGAYSVNAAVKGLYFTGDSFSHYGGWVEGAFQAGLATSAGVIQSACMTQFAGAWADHVRQDVFTAMITNARDPYTY